MFPTNSCEICADEYPASETRNTQNLVLCTEGGFGLLKFQSQDKSIGRYAVR